MAHTVQVSLEITSVCYAFASAARATDLQNRMVTLPPVIEVKLV